MSFGDQLLETRHYTARRISAGPDCLINSEARLSDPSQTLAGLGVEGLKKRGRLEPRGAPCCSIRRKGDRYSMTKDPT
jgi:hypothetical protein